MKVVKNGKMWLDLNDFRRQKKSTILMDLLSRGGFQFVELEQ